MKKVLFCLIVLYFASSFSAFANGELQQLIDQAPANSVLQLKEQMYEGNIVISKPLTIIGTEGTVIRGDGTGNVITIEVEEVHIRNLSVENSSFSLNSEEEFAAIKVHTNFNVIENIIITDSYHGVYLSQAHNNVVKNVHVTGQGNKLINGQGNGIHVYYSNHNSLIDNIIIGTRDGLFFDYANENEAIGNTLRETRYGLHFMYSHRNTFLSNEFILNAGGAAVMNSNQNTIIGNEFSLNQSTRSFGLLLQMANDNEIRENTFFQNQRGLFIDQSQNNVIERNEIVQNQIGVELWASSLNQTFTENKFMKNIASVITIGGMPDTTWSVNERGNDWGTENPVFDLNQDGIGDTPFKYRSSLYQLIEENELVFLFLNSPTIKIYEKMNQLINKDKVMVVDEYSLVEKNGNSINLLVPLFLVVLTILFIRRRKVT